MLKSIFPKNIKVELFLINFFLINVSLCAIKIAQPDELSNTFFNSELDAIYGDFGDIDMGFEALGSVWIMPRDMNSPIDLPNDYACQSLSKIKIMRDQYNFADFNIVLVEKGPCSFTDMAKQVEKIGGDMILIVNDQPGNIKQYEITNDGRGHEVSIPVAMISFNDGKAIINYILNHPKENVYLDIEIGLNKRDQVKVDLFTNILDMDTFTFLGKFKTYFDLLSNDIDMNIYYLTPQIEGLLQTQQFQDCLKNGLYCMNSKFNTKNLNLQNVKGVDLIYESLFHQCIFQKSKKSYFNFIEHYSEMCINTEKFSNFCGLSLFNGGMREIIMDCVFNSFGNADYKRQWEKIDVIKFELNSINDNVNTILVNNRLLENHLKVNSYPDIYINDKKYKNRLNAMYLFDSICDSFSRKPKACLDYGIRPTNLDKEGIPIFELILIILFVIFLNVVLFYFIKRAIMKRLRNRIDIDKNDLSGEINSVINSYFSLKEMESTSSNDNQQTNDLGDVQHFMDDEENENKKEDKEEPGSQLVISNDIKLNKDNQ
jgi:hypothetical protein